MSENLFIGVHFLTALVLVAASKLNLMEKISGHPVHSIKLRLFPAEGACVRVLLEPVELAVTAQRLLAVFALYRVFQNVVTDGANQLRQKSLNLLRVKNPFFFVEILLVIFVLVNDAFHLKPEK